MEVDGFMKTLILAALVAVTGCTSTDMSVPLNLSPQQQAGLMQLGGQIMQEPAPVPSYRPTRCTTFYRPGGRGFPASANTQCF